MCFYSHVLKLIILLENINSQLLHEEMRVRHITTADSSRWELQAMPEGCKSFFELLASPLAVVMLQMSNAFPEETEIFWGRNTFP